MRNDERNKEMPKMAGDEMAGEGLLTRALSPQWSGHTEVHTLATGNPAIGRSQGGMPFYVWEEDGLLYWRKGRFGQGGWTPRAYLAAGSEPCLVGVPSGKVHCVFSSEFGGVRNIYHVVYANSQWSLPRNVSHTSGESRNPRIAADGNTLFVVWDDDVSGPRVVYWAEQDSDYWASGPIPSARGEKPDVAYRAGVVHVAWQDDSPEVIYYSRRLDGSWSLPENISSYAAAYNTDVRLAVDENDKVHIVYGQYHPVGGDGWYIYYVCGQVGNWSPPRMVNWYDHYNTFPDIEIAGDWVLVVWRHRVTIAENPSWIMARKKTVTSEYWRWYPTEQATAGGVIEAAPDLAVEPGGKAYLIYTRGSAAYAAQRTNAYP